jgi:hypothetical protein
VKLQYWDSVSTPKVISTHISLKFWEKKKYNHFEKSWDKLELGKIDQSWDELVWDKLDLGQIDLYPFYDLLLLRYSN